MNLDKAQRDLADASDALTTYWSRGPSDLDYRAADLHMATEALMRAISTVALAVERVERDLAREVTDRQDAIKSVRAALRDQISEVYPS